VPCRSVYKSGQAGLFLSAFSNSKNSTDHPGFHTIQSIELHVEFLFQRALVLVLTLYSTHLEQPDPIQTNHAVRGYRTHKQRLCRLLRDLQGSNAPVCVYHVLLQVPPSMRMWSETLINALPSLALIWGRKSRPCSEMYLNTSKDDELSVLEEELLNSHVW
jgi:hypothetical protein